MTASSIRYSMFPVIAVYPNSLFLIIFMNCDIYPGIAKFLSRKFLSHARGRGRAPSQADQAMAWPLFCLAYEKLLFIMKIGACITLTWMLDITTVNLFYFFMIVGAIVNSILSIEPWTMGSINDITIMNIIKNLTVHGAHAHHYYSAWLPRNYFLCPCKGGKVISCVIIVMDTKNAKSGD